MVRVNLRPDWREEERLEYIWQEMKGYWAMTFGMSVVACLGMVFL
jgi:hypothetical protein